MGTWKQLNRTMIARKQIFHPPRVSANKTRKFRGEFPVFDRLASESVMHLFGRLASVTGICFKLESWSVTVFPLKGGLNTSRASVMWFVGIFPGVFCGHIEQRTTWSGNYLS